MKLSLRIPLAHAISLALVCAAGNTGAAGAFDVSELDTNTSACADLNAFVNAKWIAANPIPADQTRWGAFLTLREKSLNEQHAIAEAAAKNIEATAKGSNEQKIGRFYRSGMDEVAIEKAGYTPLKSELAKIDALKHVDDITAYLRESYATGRGNLFFFAAGADYKDASTQIAYAGQGGLGLPTPDYYTKPDYAALRDAYVTHIANLLELVGIPKIEAEKQAKQTMAIETRLAKASLSPVELRDPANQYNFVTVAEADKLTPHFPWLKFIEAQHADVKKGFSLSQPKFFVEFDKMLAEVPIADWRAYLRAHAIDAAADYLSKSFQNEQFAFYGQTLSGQKEIKARWKRVLGATNDAMGMALGELYVKENFPPEAKKRMRVLVDNLRQALKTRLQNIDWMSSETRQKALAKWETFLPKIGYPDKWRDWAGLEIGDNYFGNVVLAAKFNYTYNIAKIGKLTDRYEWGMTPQTVNAYYNPTDNTINFPAAILQSPFFDLKADDAINYGGIGGVIGHEIIHGFDDEGSQFDEKGNHANWWTKEDRAKFDARTEKLVQQFDGYSPLPNIHVNGKLTLGENIADLGGITIAYDALQLALTGSAKEKIDGFTQEQRFFMNWARIWRGQTRPERLRVQIDADPHSPEMFRAIGAPSNLDAFAAAFQCNSDDPMMRSGDKQVRIW